MRDWIGWRENEKFKRGCREWEVEEIGETMRYWRGWRENKRLKRLEGEWEVEVVRERIREWGWEGE